jgi:diguanylate cyclase (GGDEF)-like protein/PAS domain S-box-containing protein
MRVLLAVSNAERAVAASAALRACGHRVVQVETGAEAIESLAGSPRPDLLLVEEMLPDRRTADVLAAARDGTSGPIPAVILSEDVRESAVAKALEAEALDWIPADARGGWVAALPDRLQGARERHLRRDRTARLAAAFDSAGVAILVAGRDGKVESANSAFARLAGRPPEEIAETTVADLFPPKDGAIAVTALHEALAAGREWSGDTTLDRHGAPPLPCWVSVTPLRTASGRSGGSVLSIVDVSQRLANEEALLAANRRLEERSWRDHLSGLFNRYYFYEVLEREMARCQRYGQPFAVLMVDLDDFKRVNDTHGHEEGDAVLREVSAALRAGLREGDVLARYGGDEFVAVLPTTDVTAARAVADRVRLQLAGMGFGPDHGEDVTASVGLATSSDVTSGASDDLVRLADRALMAAKRRGGNCVMTAAEVAASEAAHGV